MPATSAQAKSILSFYEMTISFSVTVWSNEHCYQTLRITKTNMGKYWDLIKKKQKKWKFCRTKFD